MNVNEYGIAVLFSTGYDMSSFTTVSITFTKPDGTLLTVTNPAVSVPNVDVTTTQGVFAAHKYLSYTTVNGDIDQAGTWTARAFYIDPTPRRLDSTVATFTVSP